VCVAEDHMYLVVCEFLLLKPSLDVENVPEFYKLFYSARLEVITYRLLYIYCVIQTIISFVTSHKHATVRFHMECLIVCKSYTFSGLVPV